MGYLTKSINAHPYDTDDVIDHMMASWSTSFQHLCWRDRLSLLEQIDEGFEFSAHARGHDLGLSQRFTSNLIARMESGTLICREQAYFYLNSDDAIHREAAQVWLALYDRGLQKRRGKRFGKSRSGADKRGSPRHEVALTGLIACNDDHETPARLIDVSAGGARLAVSRAPKVGTAVTLHVPFMEPIAASVAWLTSASAGLTFLAQQPGFLT